MLIYPKNSLEAQSFKRIKHPGEICTGDLVLLACGDIFHAVVGCSNDRADRLYRDVFVDITTYGLRAICSWDFGFKYKTDRPYLDIVAVFRPINTEGVFDYKGEYGVVFYDETRYTHR